MNKRLSMPFVDEQAGACDLVRDLRSGPRATEFPAPPCASTPLPAAVAAAPPAPQQAPALQDPGVWTKTNASIWTAAMKYIFVQHSLWEVVQGELEDEEKSLLAALLIKAHLAKTDELKRVNLSKGKVLWRLLQARVGQSCVDERRRRFQELVSFNLGMVGMPAPTLKASMCA